MMTHPYTPHVFNSLGTVGSENPGFLDLPFHDSRRSEQPEPVRDHDAAFSKRSDDCYSIPTSALMYCSRS